MKTSAVYFIILTSVICTSCSKSDQSSTHSDSTPPRPDIRTIGIMSPNAVTDALDIPVIRTFLATFPENISMFLSRSKDTAIWSTKALLHGRYVLNIRVPVKDDGHGKMIQAPGPVEFHILEVSEVSGRNIRYTPHQLRFGMKEWEQLTGANFDFSAIGYTMEPHMPVPGLPSLLEGA